MVKNEQVLFTVREDVACNWYYNHVILLGAKEDPPENQGLHHPEGHGGLPAAAGLKTKLAPKSVNPPIRRS